MLKKEFTTSVYIMHEKKLLLLMHPKLEKWLPPGGHIENNESPPEAAKREVREETSLEIIFVTQENVWVNRWNAKSFERPYLCLIENIPPFKDQKQHQHIDFIYLAHPIGDTTAKGTHPLKWFTHKEIQLLKNDKEIFVETKEVVNSLFKNNEVIV